MAALKSSEKRLLTLFGFVAFIIVNVFVFRYITAHKIEAETAITTSEQKLADYEAFVKPELPVPRKRQWLDATQPVFTSEDMLLTQLFNIVQNAARLQGLEPVMNTDPPVRDPAASPYAIKAIVKAEAKGEIGALINWVLSLMDNSQFRAITKMDVKADAKDAAQLTLNLTVEQWYNPRSEQLVAASESATPAAAPPSSATRDVPPAPAPGGESASAGSGADAILDAIGATSNASPTAPAAAGESATSAENSEPPTPSGGPNEGRGVVAPPSGAVLAAPPTNPQPQA